MVSVTVSSVGKQPSFADILPLAVDIRGKEADKATVADVKAAIANRLPKFYVSRQKLSLKGHREALSDNMTLKDAGIADGGEVSVKDLGPQIGWRTVFVAEYAGPLIIHPLVYYWPSLFYGVPIQHSLLQKYVFALIILHFVKRELETLFVHRFSHATMPFRNLFKNCAHYYILSGAILAYDVYRPVFSASSSYIRQTIRDDPRFLWVCTTVWLLAQLSNLHNHLTLRALRPAGTLKRAIPYGYGFSLLSCPNYFSESIAWLSFSVMTGSWAAWLFTTAAVHQMSVWALAKHKAYKKEFGKEYPSGRKAIIPFIL
jgi:very-long-chain enoyl-CoA reductase